MRSKINRRIIKSIGKVGMVSFIILFSANLGRVYSTSSSFQDMENSSGNSFFTSNLDMEVASGGTELQDPTVATDMVEGDAVTREMDVENVGVIDYLYNISFNKVSGDDALCLALNLTADKNGLEVYNGSLMAFNYDAGAMSPSDTDNWDFEVALPAGSPGELEELDCSFEFYATAWQTIGSGPGSGWWDEEIVDNNIIHSGSWTSSALGDIVMNEFVPNPVGTDTALMPGGEWIEIYNNSLVNRDLDGWYFVDEDGHILTISISNSDNNGDTSDSGETTIVSEGYLVVYDNSSFSINNDSDTIYFYDKLGVLMDSYSYNGSDANSLTLTPGTGNADDSLGSGSSPIPSGKSFARVPDGVGAWVDPEPTPGKKVEFSNDEMLVFQVVIYKDCFRDDKLIGNKKQSMCLPVTIEYFGLIDDEDSKKLVMSDDLKKYLEEIAESELKSSASSKIDNEEEKKNDGTTGEEVLKSGTVDVISESDEGKSTEINAENDSETGDELEEDTQDQTEESDEIVGDDEDGLEKSGDKATTNNEEEIDKEDPVEKVENTKENGDDSGSEEEESDEKTISDKINVTTKEEDSVDDLSESD